MPNQEKIIEEIASYLHTYVKEGYVRFDSFSKKIHPNINRFEDLFSLRFLLHEDTKSFVQELPKLIRNFKTITRTKQLANRAEIRGAIDWPETIRTRLQTNYKDKLTFVTNETFRSFDTQENLVLKNLLVLLQNELYHNPYVTKFLDRAWFQDWKSLRQPVDKILRENIYLQRVPEAPLSVRSIKNTMKHRNPLYRRAAHLLDRYLRFKRGDFEQEEYEQLLRETFILPKEEDVLFELYWAIQIIKANTDESTLYLMDGSDNMIASWEKGDYYYTLYHDSTGPRDLSFQTYADELKSKDNKYIQQLHKSFEQTNQYAEIFFNRPRTKLYRQGRPDLILIVRHKETNEIEKIMIGEVKHTTDINYAIRGLEELLDYIHLVKYKGEYAYGQLPVKGLLYLGEIEGQEDIEQGGEKEIIQIVTPTNKKGLKFDHL